MNTSGSEDSSRRSSDSRAGVAVYDQQGRHVFANEAYARQYGYDAPVAVLDEPWRECVPSVHHDCVADGLAAVERSGRWFGRVREFDGVVPDTEWQFTFVRSATGATVVVVDEGRRPQSREERLTALNESTRDLFAADRTSVIAKTAVTVAESVLGQSFVCVWLERSDAGGLESVAGTDAARVFSGHEELTLPDIPPDSLEGAVFDAGERRLVEEYDRQPNRAFEDLPLSSVLLLPLGGYGLLGVAVPHAGDISDETVELLTMLGRNVGAALDRAQTQRELKQRNERLDEFTSVVSHDLRGPLSVVLAGVDLAAETGDDTYLDDVRRSAERMDRLIGELLTLARNGAAIGDTGPVSLSTVARQAWTSVQAPEATLDVNADATILADDERLVTVFENLFRNSVEHGGDGVTIRVGTLDGDDGYYVEDDGTGIPADRRDRVFDRGFTTDPDGTGFGLAIVERVVEAHGWSVAVEESATGGTRFAVRGATPTDREPDARARS